MRTDGGFGVPLRCCLRVQIDLGVVHCLGGLLRLTGQIGQTRLSIGRIVDARLRVGRDSRTDHETRR